MVFTFSIKKLIKRDLDKDLINNHSKLNEENKVKELSPKIKKRVKSIDNFMKFQWSWTL